MALFLQNLGELARPSRCSLPYSNAI